MGGNNLRVAAGFLNMLNVSVLCKFVIVRSR